MNPAKSQAMKVKLGQSKSGPCMHCKLMASRSSQGKFVPIGPYHPGCKCRNTLGLSK